MARFLPNATVSSGCGATAKISRQGTAQTTMIASARNSTGRVSSPSRAAAGDLGHEIEAGAHRHPDQHLGRHRGGRVGAGRVLVELVLGRDQVDVLEHAITASPAIGTQARLHVPAQRDDRRRPPAGCGAARCSTATHASTCSRPGAVGRHRDVGDERAQVGAGHAQPGHGQQRRRRSAGPCSPTRLRPTRLVVADPLQRAAQDRQLELQAAGREPDGRRPRVVLDADRPRRSDARSSDRDDGQHHRERRQRARPAPHRWPAGPARRRGGRARPRGPSPPAAPGRPRSGSGGS